MAWARGRGGWDAAERVRLPAGSLTWVQSSPQKDDGDSWKGWSSHQVQWKCTEVLNLLGESACGILITCNGELIYSDCRLKVRVANCFMLTCIPGSIEAIGSLSRSFRRLCHWRIVCKLSSITFAVHLCRGLITHCSTSILPLPAPLSSPPSPLPMSEVIVYCSVISPRLCSNLCGPWVPSLAETSSGQT